MKRPFLLVLLLVLALTVVAFLWLVPIERRGSGAPSAPPPRAEAPSAPEGDLDLIPAPVVRQSTASVTTTVLWPVKVELELLEARFLPKEEGVPPVGSDASARMSGRITAIDDSGAAAEIRFVAGANQGRVLRCDPEGRFGATDLYPGLSIVEVRGAGTLGSRRQVRLRRGQEALLNIGYGRPGSITGKVQDTRGAPIEGAAVTIDGTRVHSDAEGGFFLQSVAAGQVLCEVEREGFALYQELIWVAGGTNNADDRMTFTLKPAVELRVALQGNAGGPGPAQIYLFSNLPGFNASSAFRNQAFPWYAINPIEAWPGQPVTIGKLPPEVVKVHVFRQGARAAPREINLSGSNRDLLIPLEPAPTLSGVVTEDGQPVLGASVRLEAPDRVRATLGYFTEPSYFLETSVIPNLPPSLQEVRTDKDGRFTLSAWAEVSPVRYLEARGPGGGSWAGRFVRGDQDNVVLSLERVNLGESTFLVEFPGRSQGLPVELWIGGSPSASQVLAPGQELEVSNLVAGLWRVQVSWHAQPVKDPEDVRLEDVARMVVPLPEPCIEGQTPEQWKRAGREYPHGS